MSPFPPAFVPQCHQETKSLNQKPSIMSPLPPRAQTSPVSLLRPRHRPPRMVFRLQPASFLPHHSRNAPGSSGSRVSSCTSTLIHAVWPKLCLGDPVGKAESRHHPWGQAQGAVAIWLLSLPTLPAPGPAGVPQTSPTLSHLFVPLI